MIQAHLRQLFGLKESRPRWDPCTTSVEYHNIDCFFTITLLWFTKCKSERGQISSTSTANIFLKPCSLPASIIDTPQALSIRFASWIVVSAYTSITSQLDPWSKKFITWIALHGLLTKSKRLWICIAWRKLVEDSKRTPTGSWTHIIIQEYDYWISHYVHTCWSLRVVSFSQCLEFFVVLTHLASALTWKVQSFYIEIFIANYTCSVSHVSSFGAQLWLCWVPCLVIITFAICLLSFVFYFRSEFLHKKSPSTWN